MFAKFYLVILVVLAVLLENSGLMKAGPRQAEFEPVQDKTYRFSDVHGVDEAKNVIFLPLSGVALDLTVLLRLKGTTRSC